MVEDNYTPASEFILLGLTNREDLQVMCFVFLLAVYVVTLMGTLKLFIQVSMEFPWTISRETGVTSEHLILHLSGGMRIVHSSEGARRSVPLLLPLPVQRDTAEEAGWGLQLGWGHWVREKPSSPLPETPTTITPIARGLYPQPLPRDRGTI